jgi:hypothetical protein
MLQSGHYVRMVEQRFASRLLVALVAVFALALVACDGGGGGTSAEQKRHEVCAGLSANKAKGSTLVDEAHAAALQDSSLTTFAQALKSWESGRLTAEQNNTISATCRSEWGKARSS